MLALLRDGPEWRPPQDAARCRRLALELGYFGLDSAALDAALAPPPPPVPTILTFGGLRFHCSEHDRAPTRMSLMVDAASGLCAALDLFDFTEVAGAALPGGRVVLWNVEKPIPRDQRKSKSWYDQCDTVTQVLHLGEGLDAAGRPRRAPRTRGRGWRRPA